MQANVQFSPPLSACLHYRIGKVRKLRVRLKLVMCECTHTDPTNHTNFKKKDNYCLSVSRGMSELVLIHPTTVSLSLKFDQKVHSRCISGNLFCSINKYVSCVYRYVDICYLF